MILVANVPRKSKNRAKVAVLGGLILHGAMDFEDDFDPIDSRTLILQFGAKRGANQHNNIALIFSLNASTVWLQDQIGSRIYIPDARKRFDPTGHSSNVYEVTINEVHLLITATTTSTSRTVQAASSLTGVSDVATPPGSSGRPF